MMVLISRASFTGHVTDEMNHRPVEPALQFNTASGGCAPPIGEQSRPPIRGLWATWIFAFLLGSGVWWSTVASAAEPLAMTPEAIQERLRKSVTYLASDELEGRGIGTAGIDKAAEYIAGEFAAAGWNTKSYSGTPYHTFYMGSRYQLSEPTQATFVRKDLPSHTWELGREFTPLSLSGSGKFDLPLVFVGYGITAPAYKYDDYADLNVEGKAVVVLRHEPRRRDENSPFDGVINSQHGTLSQKVVNAIAHKAAAVIIVTDHAEFTPPEGATATPPTDKLLNFQVQSTAGNRKIPVVHCLRSVIEPVITQALQTTLDKIEAQIDADLKPRSVEIPEIRWQGEITLKRTGKPHRNVVAVLPGQGPQADETIVIGAHYDHLGRGGLGSLAFSSRGEIHNGADDNASGTATLLEIARQLGQRKDKLPRKIVCIAFTAEETGLIGSARYVADPLVPLSDTVAMLNLDMVGRLRQDKLTVYGTGTASEFNPLVEELNKSFAFKITKKPGGMGPSDHASFYPKKIPVLHYFTGLHREYHRPEDDSDLLNYVGMQRISQYVTETAVKVATAENRPTYQKVSGGDELDAFAELLEEELNDAQKSARNPTGVTAKPKGGKAYFGVAPLQDFMGPGYAIREVTPGTAAEKAGLRAGDIITGFGDQEIRQPGDLSQLLTNARPFQKFKVQFKRGETALESEVELGER